MAGQCEFHPFEQAADVCGVCYADICEGCVTAVRSRPDPICRDCAITMSGVRGSTKPLVRGDKETVEARRAALQPAEPIEDELDGDDTEWIRDDAGGIRGKLNAMAAGFLPGNNSSRRSSSSTGGPKVNPGRAKKKAPKTGFSEDSAVHKLGQLRRDDDGPATEPAYSEDHSTPAVAAGVDSYVDEPTESSLESDFVSSGHTQSEPSPPAADTEFAAGSWPELDEELEQEPADSPEPPGPLAKPADRLADQAERDWSEASVADLSQDPFATR